VPDWHRKLLAERLAAHQPEDGNGREWEEFEQNLMAADLNKPAE
jgi:hypothetical protein